MRIIEGAGGGGGGSQRTPVISPDSLHSIAYFRILDLVSEGEIMGLVNGQQSIYFNGTPLANSDGTLNFQNVFVDSRTGTQSQDYIKGYSSVENATAVNVELRSTAPWVQALTNLQLSAVSITLSVPALSQQNISNGDVTGYTINYLIEVQTDSGAWVTAVSTAFTGKTTSKYQRTHRIDLPTATTGWQVRVTRTTANANSTTIADTTTIDSYTEIIDAKLRYPNSALVAVSGDASTFSNIPTRAYDLWGRIISVPSNYDPVARTYTGVWDGSFKPSWTNNPAWVFYDLVTHPRYGLGNLITAAQVDKWALYRIAQYCDESVPDGMGGTEPRFTCNLYLQSAQDAYKVLSDLAALFRGLSYWANGVITANADMPTDPAYLYTAANVIDGKFTYQSSPRKTRYTTALVTWNNPANKYQADVEYVQHDAGLLRYGIQPVQLTALGCTSRGQAQRAGQWVLNTAQLETETVTFSVGLDGILAAPGQIIRVQDPARAGKRQAGRIHAATATAITVDRAPDAVAVGDSLTCMLPTGVSETLAITAIAGNVLSVATPGFSAVPDAEAAWVTESSALAAQLFRVVTVTEEKKRAGSGSSAQSQPFFTINAVASVSSKYGTIDTSAIIQPPPVSALPATIQAPVVSVAVAENHVILQGTAQTVATISWPAATGADTYKVEWRRDNGDWIDAGGTSGLSMDIPGVYTGTYVARVRAVSANGIVSLPTLSAATAIVGKTVPNAPPTLTATGGQLQIVLNWTWPAGVNVEDTNYTEVWVSPDSTMADGASVGAVAYPGTSYTISGLLPQQTRYAWVRLVDKSGNIGVWSVPANAVSGTTTDLFAPVQSQIDTLNSDTASLQTQVNSTQAQLSVVQGQVSDVLASPAWSSTVTFSKGEMVTESGKLYRSLIDNNLGNDPATATSDWAYIGNYASLGEAVGANASNISTLQSTVTTQGNEISANTTSINSNTAAIGTKANVTDLNTTNANVTANANAITAQGSDIALLGAHNSGKTAFVLNQSTVQVDNTGTTLGSYISSVTATTNGLQANINTEQTARINGDTANANAISSLTTTVNNNSAAITAEQTARANGDSANASAITSVQSSVNARDMTNLCRKSDFSDGTVGSWDGGAFVGTPPSSGWGSQPTTMYQGKFVATTNGGWSRDYSSEFSVTPGETLEVSGNLLDTYSIGSGMGIQWRDGTHGYITEQRITTTSSAGAWEFESATVVVPNGASYAVPVLMPVANTKLWVTQPKITRVQKQAVVTASATQSLTTSVNALTGKVDASYTLHLNANGYVSGIVAQNNGTVSNLVIVADNFEILPSSGTGLRTEFSSGNWRVYDSAGTLRVRMGIW